MRLTPARSLRTPAGMKALKSGPLRHVWLSGHPGLVDNGRKAAGAERRHGSAGREKPRRGNPRSVTGPNGPEGCGRRKAAGGCETLEPHRNRDEANPGRVGSHFRKRCRGRNPMGGAVAREGFGKPSPVIL